MPKKDLSKTKKILIIMMGGIGNMIFLTPALKAIRKAFPTSEMVFLLGPYGAEKVIEKSFLFDKKIIAEAEIFKGISGKIKLIRQLRREHFDMSITSTGSNPLKSGLLCLLAGIKHRLGENIKGKGFFYNLKIPFNKNNHEVKSNIHIVQKLGIEVTDKSLFIYISQEDKDYADNFFDLNNLEEDLVVGMHPGSGIHQADFKRWPKERFARLADLIISNSRTSVILFGGTEEISLANNIQSLMSSHPLILTGKTTLAQTAALIKKCQLFISNDSGLLHVACAVKTPTISIFGPTDYRKTGPYSDSSTLIRKDLSCSPCYVGKPIHCSHLECLHLITANDVFEIAKQQIDKHVQ